jgi:hypothetical protein
MRGLLSRSTAACTWPMQLRTRRDRRKDQLLQENGYLVLRFLAGDLGKELDVVLDSIVRSLTSRRVNRRRVQTASPYSGSVE